MKEKVKVNNLSSYFSCGKVELDEIVKYTLYDVEYDYINMDRKEVIIDLFKEAPTFILDNIFPHISNEKIENSILIYSEDVYWKQHNKIDIYATTKIDGYYKVTEVRLLDYGVYNSKGVLCKDLNGFKLRLDSIDLNKVDNTIILHGHFFGDYRKLFQIDKYNVAVSLDVKGIKNETAVQSWIEYLYEGCSYIENKNNKMAFFNIFAAMDNFINIFHEDIFDYYLEEYKACTNENVKEDIKDKIRSFSNKEKRLQNKLRHILKELNMIDEKRFNGLNNLFNIWAKKYTKIRDKIAHGGIYEESYDIGEVAYTIVTLMFSILLNIDLTENEWKSIIT
ncbi:hypothetical protein FDF18_12490 [Clostridium sporogenes]|uniref:HEPN domain-containing protein n=1 Tax=Clostridium sporogenes TaxID=1509 RepID=UPI0013CCAACE|nr:HEPN domain-containing protein [Clostridium sporogenes]NFT04101.1 hypothetical protein [Clostridium sporogenes]NFT31286.1 hypothetical protein [Clostridium sporogenes]NFT39525.1 hypothetical protein [Clostridium sporogenes]NFT54604.1 hypothetical protein [Clostridium sporogenes]NFT75755.1 hypothetical protein [Clostridium sporogenes]